MARHAHATPALARAFGYRGAALVVFGVMWVLFGVSVLFQPTEARSWMLHETIPVEIRAAMWALTGVVAIVYGVRGKSRDDTVGMGALMVMPLLRFASFSASYLIYLGTLAAHHIWPSVEVVGYGEGWYGAALWALIVALVRVLAGWPNPRQVLPIASRGEGDG